MEITILEFFAANYGTMIFLGFDVAMMVLCAVHFARSKRVGFRNLLISFSISIAASVTSLVINMPYLFIHLINDLGMASGEAAIIVSTWGLILGIAGIFAAIFLLVGIVNLTREDR
ncbi:MAG: hypothetical protein ACFFCS_06835 [Candidatus Hodarchaeota archaeon]